MICLALAWWASLVVDAARGATPWWAAAISAAALLLWGGFSWRQASRLHGQPPRLVRWHAAGMAERGDTRQVMPAHWTDDAGLPLDVHVAMDLGAGMLLRLTPTAKRGVAVAPAEWRWVDARALEGPWRWRLIASRGSSRLFSAEQHDAPMVASLALIASQKATLPKSARRSA